MIMGLGWCFWYSIIIGIAVGGGIWKITSNINASGSFGVAATGFSFYLFYYLEKIISLLEKISSSSRGRIKGGEEE